MRRIPAIAGLVLLLALSAAPPHLAAQDAAITLRVEGRSNATPWVASLGKTVVVAWGATANGDTDVFVAISHDGGRTFGAPTHVNTEPGEARLGGELPPRVALRARGLQPPEIVVLWTARDETTQIRLARSLDGGDSFAPAVTLQSNGAPGDRGWPALALDASGTAHAIWLDHRGLAARTSAHADHKTATEHDGAAMAQRSALYYASARTVSRPEQSLTPGVCYCCKTALAVAPAGQLYAAWRHVYPGNLRDMAFSMSTDGGHTFTSPIRVSEDRWQLNGCPDDGPALAVDGAGAVHIVWPTVLTGPRPEGALFYSATRDGRTFTARVRVPTMGSPKPSHPQVAVHAPGRLTVAWDEVIDGTRRAFLRELTFADTGVTFGDPIKLDPNDAAMYPVIAESDGARVVAWTSGVAGATVIKVRRL